MDNISLIDVNKPEKLQSAINELVEFKNLEEVKDDVTKASIGLGNVDNTSDINKPISAAQQEAFDEIQGLISGVENSINKLDKSSVGLSNVDNTSDASKPISSAQQDAFDETNANINQLDTKLNEVERVAKGATQSKSFLDYSTLIADINTAPSDKYRIGQNFYVETIGVPDLWISGIESTAVKYEYVLDSDIVARLKADGYIQVGYYRLSALETEKVDLTNHVTFDDHALVNGDYGLVKLGGSGSGVTIDKFGGIYCVPARDDEIEREDTTSYRTLQSRHISKIIKQGMTNNTQEWSDEDKSNARTLIDAVGKTDYADKEKNFGIVGLKHSANGIWLDTQGYLYLFPAADSEIEAESTGTYRCLQPKHISPIVKKGMTNNLLEWTDEDKANARNTINAVGKDDKAVADGDYGLIKLGTSGTGLRINSNGNLEVTAATDEQIETEAGSSRRCLMPQHVSKIVKKGMTNNALEWTEEEKTSARTLIDAVSQSEVDNKIADLIGSDAETLETLQDLSAAIEENGDVIESLNSAITSKASQESVNLLSARVTDLENNADGRQIELQASETHIQWKYVQDADWTDLVALTELKGDKGATGAQGAQGPQGETGAQGPAGADGVDGREVEFQTSSTHIQWRYVGSSVWMNLVALSTLKGDKGDTGATGAVGARFEYDEATKTLNIITE